MSRIIIASDHTQKYTCAHLGRTPLDMGGGLILDHIKEPFSTVAFKMSYLGSYIKL
jgi:hypothetical protein